MATVAGLVFTIVLLGAAIGDVRTRRIPNRLVAILAIAGFAFRAVLNGGEGFVIAGEGLLVGLACWLPFYAFGWLGAGDVKLYAAASAWLGPKSAFEGALIAALAGALLALLWMVKTRGMRRTGQTIGLAAGTPGILSPRQDGSGRSSKLPYGVAIAFGAISAGWLPGLLLK